MAYSAFDFQVIVNGHLPGSEVWANTWTFDNMSGTGDRDDAVADLHQFYTDIKGLWNTGVGADSATIYDLSDSIGSPGTWTAIVGTSANATLPQEVAIRVSLTDLEGVHGGPFLPATNVATVAATGILATASQTTLATALTNLNANLDGHDLQLRIDRPSVETTVEARQGRIGLVFDVIRRRRNNLNEAYAVVTL